MILSHYWVLPDSVFLVSCWTCTFKEERETSLFYLAPFLHFTFISCCPHCTLSILLSHRGLGPVRRVRFQCCKQQERDTDVDHRIALGTQGSLKQTPLIYFIFLSSLSNMLRWPVQIADRGSLGKGGGCRCPGIFIPGKFSLEILCNLSLTLTEKKGEC